MRYEVAVDYREQQTILVDYDGEFDEEKIAELAFEEFHIHHEGELTYDWVVEVS